MSESFTLMLTRVADAGELDAFIERGQAGEAFVYAEGPVEPRASAVWHAVREMAKRGLVTLTCEKASGRKQWIATRLAADPLTAAQCSRRVRSDKGEALTQEGEPVREAIMRLLRRAARFELPCPTNAELAECADLTSPKAATYHLRLLLAEGAIKIIADGPSKRRIVVLGVGTTKETA